MMFKIHYMPVKFTVSFSGEEVEAHIKITCFPVMSGTYTFCLSFCYLSNEVQKSPVLG